MTRPDTVVLGAGMAGLACARALAEAGQRVLVLEAQDRVGGRISTRRVDGATMELGAEFVHGRPPELLALIAEAGCTLAGRGGQPVRLVAGQLTPDSGGEREAMFAPLEALKGFSGEDLSFTKYLDRQGISGNAREAAIGYIEGFNAAEAEVASAHALGVQQAAEDANDGDQIHGVREGYDRLPEFLAHRVRALGGELRLGCPATGIRWHRGPVEVLTAAGAVHAARCVVALPLGVLTGGDFAVDPLPDDAFQAMRGLRMGSVCRFTLHFRTPFWTQLPPQPAMRAMSFLFAREQTPGVWWTTHPQPSLTLTGWSGGPRSAGLLSLSDEALEHQAVAALAAIFGKQPASLAQQLTGFHRHNWTADPWSRGAYSYVAVGGVESSRLLSEPVKRTLFFAGEHTDTTGHWGTVHAALRSGLRAATQVLETF